METAAGRKPYRDAIGFTHQEVNQFVAINQDDDRNRPSQIIAGSP
jgi:hypothetical protein